MRKDMLGRFVIIGMIALLTACGGGGNGGSGSASAPTGTDGWSVSGTIDVPAGIAMDTDVNDPSVSYSSNDHAQRPQHLREPALLGGFVTAGATGDVDDQFARASDARDVYRVALTAGETITLFVAARVAGNDPDIGLFIYAAGDHGKLLASSRTLSELERVTVPADAPPGEYDVVVEAFSGMSNYVLGLSPATSNGTTASIEDDFVPGELIVLFRDEADKGTLDAKRLPELRAQELGLTHKRGRSGQPQLLGLGDSLQRDATLSRLGLRVPETLKRSLAVMPDQVRERYETILMLNALRQRDDVLSADLNYVRKPSLLPSDTYYIDQWHYPLINLPGAWDITTGSKAVTVAVIDTGVFMAHPDLQANLRFDGYDFVRSLSSSNDGDGIDSNPDDPGDSTQAGQSSFHGTHVAGTVAAVTDNIRGVAGAGWNTELMPVRVCGLEGCTSYDVMQGVRYAAGMSNDSGRVPERPAQVINISLGGKGSSSAERALLEEIRSRGILVVAAAGNQGATTPMYPAAYESVVSVGAVDARKRRTWYSNYGSTLDVMAPGGDLNQSTSGGGYPDGVLSTVADDRSGDRKPGYAFYQGTSMAAPHVAAVIALMKAVYPKMTAAEFDDWLSAGLLADDLGAGGRDNDYGWGLINAHKAVQHALSVAQTTGSATQFDVLPRMLDFGSAAHRLTVRVAGDGSAGTITVSSAAPWLQVLPSDDVTSDGRGTYRVEVLRQGLAAGHYSALVTVSGQSGAYTELPASMQVSAVTGYAGKHYVVLVDEQSGRKAAVTSASYSDGRYSYRFDNVPAGRYRLLAGTDSNNNGYICDPGEACGAWPSMAEPKSLRIDRHFGGIDFSSVFRIQSAERAAASAGLEQRGVPRK